MKIKKIFIPAIFIVSTSFVSLIPSILNDHEKTKTKINVDNSITKNNYSLSKITTETVLTSKILNELNWNTEEAIGFDVWQKNAPFLGTELNSTTVASLGWNTKSTITLDDWNTMAPNITKIGRGAFDSSTMESIIIPSSIMSIEPLAFAYTKHLLSLNFEQNSQLKSIGFQAFESSSLKSIIIPKSVEIIGNFAFASSQLFSVKISNPFIKIGNSAFLNTSYLKDIMIDDTHQSNLNLYGFSNQQINFTTFSSNARHPFAGTILSKNNVQELGWDQKTIITLEDWDNFAPNVNTINSNAFANLQLNSIVIPNLVKEISNSAFMNSSLKDITFEDNSKLTIISDHVFHNTKIESIIIPLSVKTLRGSEIFSNTPNLTKIKMNHEFNYSSGTPRYGLTQTQWDVIDWVYPQFTGTLLDNAAIASMGWDKKTIITLEDWRTMAPNVIFMSQTFLNNQILTSIDIPNNIEYFGPSTFENTPNLKVLNFELNNTIFHTIDTRSFFGSGLETIVLPPNVNKIQNEVFSNMLSLKSIVLPPKLEILSSKLFYGSINVENIILPNKLKSILGDVFGGGLTKLTKIDIPLNVRSIAENSFAGSHFKEITMSEFFEDSVSKYGLTQTQWDAIKWVYGFFLGTELDKAAAESIGWDKKTTITLDDWTAMAPNVTIISGAFLNNEILTAIEIPNKIKSIGDSSFYGAINLNKIIFLIDSKLTSIGFDAFRKTAITSMIIPSMVSIMKSGAFAENLLLTSVTLPGELKIIEDSLFFKTGLKEIVIPDNIVEIKELSFGNTNIKKIIISNNVEKIGFNTFIETTQLIDITLPFHFKEESTNFGLSDEQWNNINWISSKQNTRFITLTSSLLVVLVIQGIVIFFIVRGIHKLD